MINWSDALSFRGWDINHPFWNAQELKELKDFLTHMGLLGSHYIVAEGYYDESISYSEGTLGEDEYAQEMPYYWVETLEEAVSTSPQGFDYPLNRADQSNAKQGYKNAINNKKAGEYFVRGVFEMLEEILYQFGESTNWNYRIKPWAFKVVDAQGSIESERDHNDNDITIGSLSWKIDIDPMGIHKEVSE